MTIKEVPKEVQFCSAITCGDTYAAKRLLPQINLFQKIDFVEFSPVVFCLWAARQSPDVALKKLKDYFPDVHSHQDLDQNTFYAPNIAETLNAVLSSDDKLLSSLGTTLLHNIVKVAPLDIQGDQENQRFILNCCVAALDFILEAQHFRPGIKEAALKLSAKLKSYAGIDHALLSEKNPEAHTLPDCVQKLMSLLNEKDAQGAEAAFLSKIQHRAYLPTQRRIAQLTEQIREESLPSGEKETSAAENMISFLVPSQQRQH